MNASSPTYFSHNLFVPVLSIPRLNICEDIPPVTPYTIQLPIYCYGPIYMRYFITMSYDRGVSNPPLNRNQQVFNLPNVR